MILGMLKIKLAMIIWYIEITMKVEPNGVLLRNKSKPWYNKFRN